MRNILPLIIFATLLSLSPARAQDTLEIGYFAEWPLPAHYGQTSGAYDEVLGANANWTEFGSSTAMFAALETGDIQIALSQGLVPFLSIVNDGFDFRLVDVAVSYPTKENCFAHRDLGFTADNTKVLNDASVAVALGTVAHFNLNRTLANFGIDPATAAMINLPPMQAAAAFKHGKVDIACGWGPALQTLSEIGTPLLSAQDKAAIGAKNYDAIVIRASFGADNPEVVAQFLKVTADLNASFTASPAHMVSGIATPMNMPEPAVVASLQGLVFPTMSEKLSADWLGGGVQTHLKDLATFFVAQNMTSSSLENYDDVVDGSYLETAANLPLIAQ